ncbi:ROK family protein [Streptomyces sp. NPDC015131]|uniref:ROK family protein n=1 Tax=Streptomyces sp. NPDC015131 TaxID=3364941 RepID=UPI00370365D6
MTSAAVGIDIGGTKLLMVARPAGRDELLTRRADTGPGTTPEAVRTAVGRFLADHRLTPASLGVAVPGLVENGRVTVCDVLPGLTGWPGPAASGVPRVLVNDIRGALAEEAAGVDGTPTVAVLLCGTAVGSACLHEGRVLRGSRGWAGEIGYMPLPTPRGIRRLDDLAGGAALVRATGLEPAEIHSALAAGDSAVRAAVDAAGEALELAMATLVNSLNPGTLRTAGGTLGYPGYWDAALATAGAHALPQLWDACAVARIEDPETVVARGALRLAAAAADREPWVAQYL